MYYGTTKYVGTRSYSATNIRNTNSSLKTVVFCLMSLHALQVITFMLASCVVLKTASAKNFNEVHIVRNHHSSGKSKQQEYYQHQDNYDEQFSSQKRSLQRDSMAALPAANNFNLEVECDAVRGFFENIDINMNRTHDKNGNQRVDIM